MVDGHGHDGQQKYTIHVCDACRPHNLILSILKPIFRQVWPNTLNSLRCYMQISILVICVSTTTKTEPCACTWDNYATSLLQKLYIRCICVRIRVHVHVYVVPDCHLRSFQMGWECNAHGVSLLGLCTVLHFPHDAGTPDWHWSPQIIAPVHSSIQLG